MRLPVPPGCLVVVTLCAAVRRTPTRRPPRARHPRRRPPRRRPHRRRHLAIHADAARPTPGFDTWVVGAEVLPRRPDGFGEVRATPPQLRERLLPTVDSFRPRADGRFHASVSPVTPSLVRRTDLAWKPACPVGLWTCATCGCPSGGSTASRTPARWSCTRRRRGRASASSARCTPRVPARADGLVTQADLDAPPTGDGNDTGAYACRPTTGATSWSAHAYGLAIDINPFNNPYTKGDLVLPELSSSYLDRDWKRPGMIYPGDVVTTAFADIGWTWGGTWQSLKDRHHFSRRRSLILSAARNVGWASR